MEYNRYTSITGQTVLSTADLTYALTIHNELDVRTLTPDDMAGIIMVKDPYIAEVIAEAISDAKQLSVKEALENPCGRDQKSIKNYIVRDNKTTYIRNGRKYENLDTFLKQSTPEALSEAFRKIVFWADVTHLAALLNSDAPLVTT